MGTRAGVQLSLPRQLHASKYVRLVEGIRDMKCSQTGDFRPGGAEIRPASYFLSVGFPLSLSPTGCHIPYMFAGRLN